MAKTTAQATASAPKRRADAERSITAITNAALEALASDPDASMAAIARRAGVVRATIYMHFPTRESLLDAVMEEATGRVAEAIRNAEPNRGEPEEALERTDDLRPTGVGEPGHWPGCWQRLSELLSRQSNLIHWGPASRSKGCSASWHSRNVSPSRQAWASRCGAPRLRDRDRRPA